MSGNKKLKVAFTTLISILCIAGVSWWIYISFTFVPFEPLAFNDRKEPVVVEVPGDFYKNLRVVLDGYHILHKLDILNHTLIPLKVARDKELLGELTEKAQDIVWLYNHTKDKYSSLLCIGEGYEGFALKKGRPYFIGGDSVVDIDINCAEVALAERVLRSQIEAAGGLKAWGIKYELPDYYRQYLGYRDASGEVVVYIYFSHKRVTTISQIRDHLHLVEDGGSMYWKVEVNINRKTVSHLVVNGVA